MTDSEQIIELGRLRSHIARMSEQYDDLVRRHTAKVREAQQTQRAALGMGRNALKWMAAMMLALGRTEVVVRASAGADLAKRRLVREKHPEGWLFKLTESDEPVGRDSPAP